MSIRKIAALMVKRSISNPYAVDGSAFNKMQRPANPFTPKQPASAAGPTAAPAAAASGYRPTASLAAEASPQIAGRAADRAARAIRPPVTPKAPASAVKAMRTMDNSAGTAAQTARAAAKPGFFSWANLKTMPGRIGRAAIPKANWFTPAKTFGGRLGWGINPTNMVHRYNRVMSPESTPRYYKPDALETGFGLVGAVKSPVVSMIAPALAEGADWLTNGAASKQEVTGTADPLRRMDTSNKDSYMGTYGISADSPGNLLRWDNLAKAYGGSFGNPLSGLKNVYHQTFGHDSAQKAQKFDEYQRLTGIDPRDNWHGGMFTSQAKAEQMWAQAQNQQRMQQAQEAARRRAEYDAFVNRQRAASGA